MAKSKGKTSKPRQEAPQPPEQLSERAYGPGVLPTLYNGQNSAISPQITPPVDVLTNAGMNSPEAAPQSAMSSFYGNTGTSLIPAGQGNPMEIYCQNHRPFPFDGVPPPAGVTIDAQPVNNPRKS